MSLATDIRAGRGSPDARLLRTISVRIGIMREWRSMSGGRLTRGSGSGWRSRTATTSAQTCSPRLPNSPMALRCPCLPCTTSTDLTAVAAIYGDVPALQIVWDRFARAPAVGAGLREPSWIAKRCWASLTGPPVAAVRAVMGWDGLADPASRPAKSSTSPIGHGLVVLQPASATQSNVLMPPSAERATMPLRGRLCLPRSATAATLSGSLRLAVSGHGGSAGSGRPSLGAPGLARA